MKLEKYLDIPFKEHGRDCTGVDCWGLVRLVFHNEFGIDLPSYDDEYIKTEDREAISNVIDSKRGEWIPVSKPQPGDVVLLAIAGFPCHVGIIMGENMMLNSRLGVGVALEDYMRPYWNRRLRGFFRHRDMITWETTGVPSFEFAEYEPSYS